jgi:integrase
MKIWKLTARFVETAKDGLHSDGGCLHLQVSGGGNARSWIFLYTSRKSGRKVHHGLGSAATVSLAAAREMAQECRLLLHDGKDPLEEHNAKKRAHEAKFGLAQTVEQLSDKYYATKIANKSPSYKKNTIPLLEHISRTIGALPVGEVTPAIILAKAELGKWWIEKHIQARHLLMHLRRMFSMAMAERTITVNPAAFKDSLEHLLPDHVHTVKHYSSLDHRELPRFMVDLRGYEDRSFCKSGHTISAFAAEFAILAAARPCEVCRARWKEIDGETWNVPPEHLKTGKAVCRRPITSSMMAVLQAMERRFPDRSPDDFIFPSEHGGQIYVQTLRTVIARLGWQIKITSHGFRSTFCDWARVRGYSRDLIDLQLDHAPPRKEVWQAYAREDLLSERRTMMQEYDDYASRSEPHATNVIPLRKAGS